MTQGQQRRRRILVVAYCFPPHAAIGTYRTLRLVSHLANRAWDIDVLTVHSEAYFPDTPVEARLLDAMPRSAHVVRSGAIRGFSKLGGLIQRMRRRRFTSPNGEAYQRHETKNARVTLKTVVEEICALPDKEIGWFGPAVWRGLRMCSAARPDVIFSSAPPWTTHLVSHVLASIFGCPWVADFRDPWVRSPWTRYRTRPAMAIARRMESRVIKRANAVIFTTQTAKEEFTHHYGSEFANRFHVVFNGCDPTEFPVVVPPPHNRRFVLLHAGSLYGGRSPLPLLHAVANLRHRHAQTAERLRLRFLGSTDFYGVNLANYCADLGLDGLVDFLPRVERQQSLIEMRQSSALLILQAGTAMAIPGKLYEYIAADRPVLALCEEGEMAQFVRTHRLGLVAPPTEESAIERALVHLLTATPDTWAHAPVSLFDGRLRAAELGAVIETVLPATALEPAPVLAGRSRRA